MYNWHALVVIFTLYFDVENVQTYCRKNSKSKSVGRWMMEELYMYFYVLAK